MKKTWIIILIVIVIGLAVGFALSSMHKTNPTSQTEVTTPVTSTVTTQPATPPSVAGTYENKNIKSPKSMIADVYQDSATSILFYLDLFESGNIGNLYGRATETSPNVYTFYDKQSYGVCNFTMTFTTTSMTLQSAQNDHGQGCGFGNGVSDDATYIKDAGAAPIYYINGEGDKIYFDGTTTKTTITYPVGGEHLVVGKSYNLKWTGGSDDMSIFLIDVALKSVGTSVSSVDRVYHVDNTGSYNYTIPSYVTPGTYQLEIGDATSNEFQIVAK